MGNLTGGSSGPPKYYTKKEAINILGDETWVRLRKQLERFARSGRYVDYQLFSRILYRRYERMVTTNRYISTLSTTISSTTHHSLLTSIMVHYHSPKRCVKAFSKHLPSIYVVRWRSPNSSVLWRSWVVWIAPSPCASCFVCMMSMVRVKSSELK